MSLHDALPLPGDTTLLLRVYAEHRWLAEELMNVVEQVESQTFALAAARHLPGELAAAREQLQTMWSESQRRAAHTDRAFEGLAGCRVGDASWLVRQTCSYYRWLRNLRSTLAARVEPFLHEPRCAGRATAA